MNFSRIGLIGLALLASVGFALGQQGAFPNYPIVSGAAYCSSTTNAVCTNTVPAGPTALTGAENIPANTNLSNGRSPQNVLIKPASIGALPITVVAVTAAGGNPTPISASDVSGGVIYNSNITITAANITLPANPIAGQKYAISANRTITALNVTAGAGETMAANTTPTVLTANTTGGPQGYLFMFNLGDTTWYRLQ